MPLQTAPSSMTVTVDSNDNVFTLVDINDLMITYRGTKINGVDVTEVAKQPVFTISRRPANSKNKTVKYHSKLEAPVYNLTGDVRHAMICQSDDVISEGFQLLSVVSPGYIQEVFGALSSESEVRAAKTDGSWFR